MDEQALAIAAAAARLIVEDGMEWGPAKRQAVNDLDLPSRTPVPDNTLLESAVREHIAIFCPDTQAQAMSDLLVCAVAWMQRMPHHNPFLTGAVWQGLATDKSDVFIQLFSPDCKLAHIDLINMGLRLDSTEVTGINGREVLTLSHVVQLPGFNWPTCVHWVLYDEDDVRGARKPKRSGVNGRASRGDLLAVQAMQIGLEMGDIN
ncbi:MAG: hypothetical protein QMB32_00710 [Burkholderiaceae bacterium]|jgi:hypothetical protein|tara:strand:+ start:1628 stop:2242 length:615 start_codon:yes stop_codon:yes gene_type:complete